MSTSDRATKETKHSNNSYTQNAKTHDSINRNSINDIELSLLKDDYEKEKNVVYDAIKDAIAMKKLDYPEDYIVKYDIVAKDDPVYRGLMDRLNEVVNSDVNINNDELNKYKYLYAATSDDNVVDKYRFLKKLFELDPNNNSYQSELEILQNKLVASDDFGGMKGWLKKKKDQFNLFKLPEDSYFERLELCKKLLQTSDEQKYRDEMDRCERVISEADNAQILLTQISEDDYETRIDLLNKILMVSNESKFKDELQRCKNNLDKKEEGRIIELKMEYQADREYIINQIQMFIKNECFNEANNLVETYSLVVPKTDKEFISLKEEINRYLDVKESIAGIKALLKATPDNNYERKYELCVEILKKDPHDVEVIEQFDMCETKLGLRPIVSTDLRLGRMQSLSISGKSECSNDKLMYLNGNLILRLHTHGVSIVSSGQVYRIHYSQIILLDCVTKIKASRVFKLIVDAGLTFVDKLNSSGDAADALVKTGRSIINSRRKLTDDYLGILYWNIDDNRRDEILIEPKNKAELNSFIQGFNTEIELTRRTNRSPKSEVGFDYGKYLDFFKSHGRAVFVGIVLVAFVIVAVVLLNNITTSTTSSSESYVNVSKENVESQHDIEPLSPPPTDNIVDDTAMGLIGDWNFNNNICSIKKSGTTLTVSGKSASAASVEIMGAGMDSCETVSVVFDKKSPLAVNCSVSGKKVKLSTDSGFIKKMRNSNSMTVIIPDGTENGKSIKYSLMGFSKACDWTK